MKTRLFLLFILVFLLIIIFFRPGRTPIPTYKNKTFTANGDTLPYRLLEPVRIKTGRIYPLVIFLHGAGERGNDNEKQLTHGTYIFQKPTHVKEYPCYVLAPQCPEEMQWVYADWHTQDHRMPEEPSRPLQMVRDLTLRLQETYPIDPNRIYVTGLSMGGFGTWDMIARWPELFAAAVPVCGGGDPAVASHITHIPVWIFHSADDPVVPVELSRKMAEAMEKAGGTVRYTEYQDAGHASWKRAYEENNLLPWLFSQEKKID
jgi:predicted peptidase